ncbi:DUF6404 family protein [Vibrio renipiscarius]|uniref:Uncharacterized protein n=1 Tax=Vibrio renipiscarius TaxID=1461322 RepID=A0A0C2K344_9VIBR|nr:DUF6404 family protein [Vibrio renipiscarius]KII76388.1 hypothetical protein OJ16_16475 [Vibrio renipiscarius]KII78090.1 hypothetical protein PL18_14095 [Vibrio renipiscarius]
MDYETKLKLAHQELSHKGVWPSNFNPPMAKLLRSIGLRFPPPYYQTFLNNCFISMMIFAPIWGLISWFMTWRAEGKPVLEAVYMALIGGLLFGLCMAIFYFIRRKQLKLTDWRSLGQ